MTDIHISEFVKGRTQEEVAEILGVTQGAVHQMLKAKREIYFELLEDGSYSHYEIKRPKSRAAA